MVRRRIDMGTEILGASDAPCRVLNGIYQGTLITVLLALTFVCSVGSMPPRVTRYGFAPWCFWFCSSWHTVFFRNH